MVTFTPKYPSAFLPFRLASHSFLLALKKLNLLFMLHRRLPRFERAEISTLSCLGIL
jgi:hypothetical protein